MLKIVICGANGKMGRAVIERAKIEDEFVRIVGHINSNSFANEIEEITSTCDVVIDFSLPSGTSKLLESLNPNVALVVCVTNLSESTYKKLEELSKTQSVLYAPNTSIGANLLAHLCQIAAHALPDYDIEIIDIHHNQKKDTPSGTALKIRGDISEVRRESSNKVGISSLRCGNIFGTHQVIFAGANEVLTLTHVAESRALFAEGAIKAARFLSKAEPGRLYNMKDVYI